MASEKLGIVPSQQTHNELNSHPQRIFAESFSSDPGPKAATTSQLTSGFLGHHNSVVPPPPPQAVDFHQQWNANFRSSGAEVSEHETDDDDMEEEDEEEDDLENIVTVAKTSDSNQNERYGTNSKIPKMKHISAFGIKTCNLDQSGNESINMNSSNVEVRNSTEYFPQYLNEMEGPSSSSRQKHTAVMEDGCGFSGRKEGSYFSESGESLRAILSDPLTGTLMDDAMILPCGHSFSGGGGIHQVIRMKACCTCSQPVSENSIAPNLTLRQAVQAFRREEDLHVNRTSKRKREKYNSEKGTDGDSPLTHHQKGKGVQFPFAVTDRVVIKGNKRTPEHFVGREAIVTTQCLNGWYVVKTLDNAESVKLQYRSLAKAEHPSSKAFSIKTVLPPSWLQS